MVTKKIPKVQPSPQGEMPVRFYRRIAFGFVALTGVLILLAAYFVLSKAKIAITVAKEPISVDFIADLKETPGDEMGPSATVPSTVSIYGQLDEMTVSGSKEYLATGQKTAEGDVGGKVTIFNNYNKAQPLVATTRLLSPEGILFRIKERVDIPPGGKVETEVYADPPTEAAAKLGPTRFKIPGLWIDLQDKIYGQSFESMHGGKQEVKFVTQTDLDNAYNDLTQELSDQVMESLKTKMKSAGEILGKVMIKEVNEKRSDSAAGEEGDKFTVYLKLKVVGVAFYGRDLESLAFNQLQSKVSAEKELFDVDYNSLAFLVEKYDLKSREANITVHLDGEMALRSDRPMFAADKFIGLSRDQIIQYLSTYPEIERVTIEFSPFWVNKVPQLRCNVKITIKK